MAAIQLDENGSAVVTDYIPTVTYTGRWSGGGSITTRILTGNQVIIKLNTH